MLLSNYKNLIILIKFQIEENEELNSTKSDR